MAGKKYNSLFELCVSVDHDEKDGSDLTARDFREAFNRRLAELGASDSDWLDAVSGPPWTPTRSD